MRLAICMAAGLWCFDPGMAVAGHYYLGPDQLYYGDGEVTFRMRVFAYDPNTAMEWEITRTEPVENPFQGPLVYNLAGPIQVDYSWYRFDRHANIQEDLPAGLSLWGHVEYKYNYANTWYPYGTAPFEWVP